MIETDINGKVYGTNIWHQSNWVSVGRYLNVYLQPGNVSFDYIKVREGYSTAAATNFLSFLNGGPHGPGGWVKVSAISNPNFSQVDTKDESQFGPYQTNRVHNTILSAPSYEPCGVYGIQIPWDYYVPIWNETKSNFSSVYFYATNDSGGGAAMTKGFPWIYKALNDPDSTY